MEKEQKCENGPIGEQHLNSHVTIVSGESPSARGKNRSIRTVVGTGQKRPERRAVSDLYASSSNPPNYQDEHNSPSPLIDEARLECTKCEPAGVHEKKCRIFQQTGSALLNECSEPARLVGVSHSGCDKFGEVVCDSVRLEGSECEERSDGYENNSLGHFGSISTQDAFHDKNSAHAALLASSGNSESIFRSYVINQNVSSTETAVSECIPEYCGGVSKDLLTCGEATSCAGNLENGDECERCGSHCFDQVKTDPQCDCCSCPVSTGLSDLAAKPDHQKWTISDGHVCQVTGLCPTAVLEARSEPRPCVILSTSGSGAESSDSGTHTCTGSSQCNCISIQNSQSKVCEQNNCSYTHEINRKENTYSVASVSTTSFLTPLREAKRNGLDRTLGSSEKLDALRDSVDSLCPSLHCLVEPCPGGQCNRCCACSKAGERLGSPTLHSCVSLSATHAGGLHRGAFQQSLDDVGSDFSSPQGSPAVEANDDVKIRDSQENGTVAYQGSECAQCRLYVNTTVECTNEVDTQHGGNVPETIYAIKDGKSVGLDSSVLGGKGQRLLSSGGEFVTPVLNGSNAHSCSGDNSLQKDKRIEVSPAVRRSLIQISKTLQKKQSKARIVNEIKSITHKKETDARTKSLVESRKFRSSNSKENLGNITVKCGRQKKLTNSQSWLVLTNSCPVSQTGTKNSREPGLDLYKSSPSCLYTPNGKCKSHILDKKSCSITSRHAGRITSATIYSEEANKSESPKRSLEQRLKVLVGQKETIVVRQTRASILRCTGQQQKTPGTVSIEDVQKSSLDSSTIKELRSSTLVGGRSSSTVKSPANIITPRSSKNVIKLGAPKPPITDKVMANAGIINKRHVLVKRQKSPEKQAVKVQKEVKSSTTGVGHSFNTKILTDVRLTLKEGSNAAARNPVAKVSRQDSQAKASKADREPDSAVEVPASLGKPHHENKSTNDRQWKGNNFHKNLPPAIAPVSRKLQGQKTCADKVLAGMRPPASTSKKVSSSSASLITTKKKLNIPGVSSSVHEQPPVLSPVEGDDVTLQCNSDTTPASFSTSTIVDNRCQVALTSHTDHQPMTKPSSRLKQTKSSAPVSTKPALGQSLQGPTKRQPPFPSLKAKHGAYTGRAKPSAHPSSISPGMKSGAGLSSERKQPLKETILSSSASSTIKSSTSQQSGNPRLNLPHPLVQSTKTRPPSTVLETTQHQENVERERQATSGRYQCSTSNNTGICTDVTASTETAPTDPCHNKVAETVYSVENSRNLSIICDVHNNNPLTQQLNTAARRSIPRYSKTLIKVAGKNDTQARQKESVLKSILINTSDRKLNGQADMMTSAFHKPVKEEDENTSLYPSGGEEGQETHSHPDTINSSNIEYTSGYGICGGTLVLTELHREEALEAIKTDTMTGDSDLAENRPLEASEVTAGEGHAVPMLGKRRETVTLKSKKTAKEDENIRVRKQSPNLPMKQRKVSPPFGQQVNSLKEDTLGVTKADLSKKTPIGYLLYGRRSNHSVSSADQMNQSQVVPKRDRLVKTGAPTKAKSDQTTGVKIGLESKKLNKTVPKQSAVTRAPPSLTRGANKKRSSEGPRTQVKSLNPALETSVGSCSESAASVLSEILSASSSSSISFSSCEQTTPEREDGKSSLFIKTVKAGNSHTTSHVSECEIRYPTKKTAGLVMVSVGKSVVASSHVSKIKTGHNIAARKGSGDKNSTTFRNKTESGVRGITQQKYAKRLQDDKIKKTKGKCETDMQKLINNEESETTGNKQLANGPVLSKRSVFADDVKHRVAVEESSERVTEDCSLLIGTKGYIVSDKGMDVAEVEIIGNSDTNIHSVQLLTEEMGSNVTVAAEYVRGLKQATAGVGLQEFHACNSRENRETLDMIYVQSPAATVNHGTPDQLYLTGSCVACLKDSGFHEPTLPHMPPIRQTDRPQIAAEASKCKQGVSQDTPIEGESARELNASDIDSRERARPSSAQRKEAGSEEKEKVEDTETAISNKPTVQDSCLQFILPADIIRCCDRCKCVLYRDSLFTSSSTNTDTVEITNQLASDVSVNGIHSYKGIDECRCLDITENMSSVSELLHFQSVRNELGYELLMDNSSDMIHSSLCCHCISTQKATEAMASVPGPVRHGAGSLVFDLSTQDQEERGGVSHCDPQSNMGAQPACDESMTEVDIVSGYYKHETQQHVVNVDLSSSADQVSENEHLNDVTNVSDDHIHTAPISNRHVTVVSESAGAVHTQSSHISEIRDVNGYNHDDVGKDKETSNGILETDNNKRYFRELPASNDLFETDNNSTSFRELPALSADRSGSFLHHNSTSRDRSSSFSEAGRVGEMRYDVVERAVGEMDVSFDKLNQDAVTSLLSTDESFYATPVGHSFHRAPHRQECSHHSAKLESIFSNVDDSDIPEYLDDFDDKNDTESSGSSDSSYQSATSDILTSTESSPDRELAAARHCQVNTASGGLQFITLDSTGDLADCFLDAASTPHQQYDSYKQEFSSHSFNLDSVNSDQMSVNSTPSGCNRSQQSCEASPTKTSRVSDVSVTRAACSRDASVVSQTFNTPCLVSSHSEAITEIGIHLKEVDMYKNRDMSLKENIARPTSLIEKWNDDQEPHDISVNRNAFNEHKTDSCSKLDTVSKLCGVPDSKNDLLSSLSYVDDSTTNVAYEDTVPRSNRVYACSSTSSCSEFSSLAYSPVSQHAAEKAYRQRQNSEEKMPSFLSMRSLSMERNKSGKSKSKSLPRSRSSSTVTSSIVTSCAVSSSTVTCGIVTSSTLTSTTVTSSPVTSSTVISSTVPSPTSAPSTRTSPIVISSTKSSSTVASLIMTTSTIATSTAMSSTVASNAMASSPVMRSYLSETQQLLNHGQLQQQQQQQQHGQHKFRQQEHRQPDMVSHCHQTVSTQLNHAQLREPASKRQTYTSENEDKLTLGMSECSIVKNRELTSTDKVDSAQRRKNDTAEEHSPQKGNANDDNQHVNTLTSQDPKMQLKESSNLKATASRPTSIFKPKDTKLKVAGDTTNKSTQDNTSQGCRKSDNQEQHIQQFKCANEPDNLRPNMQNINSNTRETCSKSSEQGKDIKQPKLTSQRHTTADNTSSRQQATAIDPEPYLSSQMEHPLTSMEIRYNFSNQNSDVSDDTLPASECTSTEFSLQSSAETLAFKSSLFESGYSSDIKSPEVKSPGKEFMDSHRQSVYGNHRQTVQTVSDNITLHPENGNKITISDSLSPAADLKYGIQSKTRETTLLDNRVGTTCKHSLEDLSPLSTAAVEHVEKPGCETARGGEISHFKSEQYEKVTEGDAREKISRGGYLGDIPHELSTLCRDNVDILGKSVPEVHRQNIAPDLDSKNSSNSCSHALDGSVSNSVNEVSSAYQEQHSELAHNESFVDAKTQLQKHAAPSRIAFSDTIAISECLKIAMPNEYKHTSTRSDASNLANVLSETHARGQNLISSGTLTEIQKEPEIVDEEVTKIVDFNPVRGNHSCSEYLNCECMIRKCCIHEGQRCTCSYTDDVSVYMSINTPADLDDNNDHVYSHITMSQQRTSDAQVTASFKNVSTNMISDPSDYSVHVKCKLNSVTDVSAGQDKLSSVFIKHNTATEPQQHRRDKGNKILSKTWSKANTHRCIRYTDRVYLEDNVHVRHGVDVNRDSAKDVHACAYTDDVVSSSLVGRDSDVVNYNTQVGNVCDLDKRSLCPELQISQSRGQDNGDTTSNSDYVQHGGSSQRDVYLICEETHLPQRRMPHLSAPLPLKYNQSLSDQISIADKGTVAHSALPGPIHQNDTASTHTNYQELITAESTVSCIASCNSQGEDSALVSHMSKKTHSPGNSSDPAANASQCEDNINSLSMGSSGGSAVVRLSLPLVDLNTRSRQDKSGLQSPRRRSPTCRHEGLSKETSPFILEKVCELLSKASANEQQNLLPPKSPLPHKDISRATVSKSRPLTPDSKARASEKRVIKKWKSVVEKSKAARNEKALLKEKAFPKEKDVNKEKLIAMTLLSPNDTSSQLPPQISPTSWRKYKWERGDSGIWMKVYISEEDSRDNQVIEHIDNGEECHEVNTRHTFINIPTSNMASASSINNTSAHSNNPTSQEIQVTVIEKTGTSVSTPTRTTNYSNIKTPQRSNDHYLPLSEPMSNSGDADIAQETMILSSTSLHKPEDHQKDNNKPVQQTIEDIRHNMNIENTTATCKFMSSGATKNDLVAFSPETKSAGNTCDDEPTRPAQRVGSLYQDNDDRTKTKPTTEAADKFKRAEKLEQKTRKHIWPTVAESLKRFQKSRAAVPSWEHFKKGQGQGFLDTHCKHNTSATESNIKNANVGEEQANGISGFSSVNESKSNLIINIDENATQLEKTSVASGEESCLVRDEKSASSVQNISSSALKEPPSAAPGSTISTTRKTISTTITGTCARPQTLEPSGQISATFEDSVVDALRKEERSIKSCWTVPCAPERTLPPSPIITLPRDAITTRHSPQRTSPMSTDSARSADPLIFEITSSSSNITDHTDLSSSSDADSATPVVEIVTPAKSARSKSFPVLAQPERNNKQHHAAALPQPDYSQHKLLRQMSQQIDKQSSMANSSYCIPELQATSVVTTNTDTTVTTAVLPDLTEVALSQPGVRRHVPSTKLISVTMWDTHDGDKSLRNVRRLWTSEDKHTLAEISEIEEAHTVHESIHGKASGSETEESTQLEINDDCVDRVRASRSPVCPHAKQKPRQRRSLSLPSGGLSYGDVKILYKDGHFVLVDTSVDRASKAAGDTTGALDNVFEEAEGTDQSSKANPHERHDDGNIKSRNYSDSGLDDTAKKTKQTSLSFDICDTGLNMRRCGLGGSIFYSLPRRKIRSQNSKSNDDAKMWRSQQSLMSQTEMNGLKQREDEETASRYMLGPGLRRNNSFTEAMGSTVILTDKDRKRNHKVKKHIDTLDNNNDEDINTYNSYQREVVDDVHDRKSRSKGPGFIQRMLQKRKGTSSLSLSMSSLKPQNTDFSSSSLSLASSVSSSSLQHTSPGRSDSRDTSLGRKISFRGFFKRKNSADLSTKKSAASDGCSSPPLAAFLSNDDIGTTVPSAHNHTRSKRITRHGSLITGNGSVREDESYSSYQLRPRSSSTHVSASSSQCSVYRSRSHDESDRSPIAGQSDSVSRRARSLSERAGRAGRILSEEQMFSGESSSEFDLNSPDPHNSDGTLTPRSMSPCAADLSGDQTLLASPVLSQKPSHIEHHHVTSNPPRSKRTRSRCEETFQRTCSAHGDSSLSILTQRTDNGEIISSNSNDSGIQKDFSVNSSAESIQTAAVKLRESHSPSPTSERPKSDSTVRWADWMEHAVQPWSVQHLEETNKQHKLPRATSETVDENFVDNGSENERNEDNVDKWNEVEESSEGGIYMTEHRRNAMLNARSLGNITNTSFTATGVRSVSCCSTSSNTSEVRALMQSRESLMNLVELRRPSRDATSAKLAKLRRLSTPQPITARTEKPRARPPKAPHVATVLTHAHSMPDNLDKLTRKKNYFSLIDSDSQSITSQQSICDNSSDESEYSMDYHAEQSLSTRSSHVMLATIDQMLGHENLTLAEALWDHVTMDPDELAFRAGDLISVTDGTDKHWWFGVLDGNEGWFPATFVRLRVNQDVVEEDLTFLLASDEALIMSEAIIRSEHAGKAVTSTGYQGMQQARANVVNEIINAEREYVKHLHDVIEGYVKQTRKRPEMFPIEKVTVIFSNIEDIYLFATELLAELDKSIIPDQPHLSELGHCFLDKVRKFEMYSDYCNNHSAACEELRELYRNKRYRHFFEACRLLQEMIEIPLEGFLLTPVQKICKYHLQLAELLKFTAPDHPDFHHVQAALEAMKKIAMLINERKRKMESVEKLAAWQLLVDGWEGPDILDDSSELIYSGDLNKINHAGWSQERCFFLFDHQLIYCKKDLLKKAGFCFKGRINMDNCEVVNVADGREPQYNVSVRNAWKLRDCYGDKWYLLVAKTTVAKQRWLKAFQDERKRVKDDTENNFNIPYHVKQAVITNFKQKNTIQKPKGKGHLSRANTAEVISSIHRVNAIATLPRTKNRHKVKSEGVLDTGKKMKWFFFGKGKT